MGRSELNGSDSVQVRFRIMRFAHTVGTLPGYELASAAGRKVAMRRIATRKGAAR